MIKAQLKGVVYHSSIPALTFKHESSKNQFYVIQSISSPYMLFHIQQISCSISLLTASRRIRQIERSTAAG